MPAFLLIGYETAILFGARATLLGFLVNARLPRRAAAAHDPRFSADHFVVLVEVAGPERVRLSEIVQQFLRARNDSRIVVPDVEARYFGARLTDGSLVPGEGARIAPTRFDAWLAAH